MMFDIVGEMGRMYEASVDDVGYRLVAVYTPVREDGVEGKSVSASTEPIAVGKTSAQRYSEYISEIVCSCLVFSIFFLVCDSYRTALMYNYVTTHDSFSFCV